MAIASTVMLNPNYPFLMSSFGSDDNESNEQFEFNISKELLLDPKDVVVGEMIGEGANSIVYKGLCVSPLSLLLKYYFIFILL